MVLVLIPEGTFLMGSPDGDPYARSDEKTGASRADRHPFYLGACEVTVGQFRAFVDATGYSTKAETRWQGRRRSTTGSGRNSSGSPSLNWRNPGFRRPQADDEPVVQVCWDDATAFCKWLSQREGVHYRLPTEAEWEYACRAGSQSVWSFGDDPDALCDYAWFKRNAGSTTQPVGRKRPNPFGLYDMYGNVWEWCKDRYTPSYADDHGIDPKGPSEEKPERVLRGGSWGSLGPSKSGRRIAGASRKVTDTTRVVSASGEPSLRRAASLRSP